MTPDPNENTKYPKAVWFIVLNELCERFNYYGLRTVLVLYLTTVLRFDGNEATIIYHTFVFMAYFMPLPGAILADSYWGKYNTIIRLSIVYAFGNIILTGASAANAFSLNVQRAVTLLGLFLISVGTGGIKPCVFAFGGDQFRESVEKQHLLHFTTNFFIAINVGSLVSTFLTPELRHSVHCLGRNTCFPLAFGVPAAIMLTAIVIFISGKNLYTRKKPEHNVISRTFGCIFYALRTKITSSVPCQTHWLDNAKGVYSDTEIMDTKTSLKALSVFMAFPIFWALYEQQSSRWTLQATLMNGHVDFLNWTIKPDQLQIVIPFFGLILLYLFDVTFYPLLAKVGIRKPLQKFTLSGLMAVVAFIVAALLEIKIFGNSTVIPPGEGSVNIYNGFDCKVSIVSPSLLVDHIDPLQMINARHTNASQEEYVVEIEFQFSSECSLLPDDIQFNTTLSVIKGREISYYLTRLNSNTVMLNRIGNYDILKKEKFGNPKLRFLTDGTFDSNDNITLNSVDDSSVSYYFSSLRETNFTVLQMGKYSVLLNGPTQLATVDLIPATFYTLILQRNGEKMDVKLFAADEGNYIHILWQVPQFLCMIISDVIFVVTSTEFSFAEAPIKMKSFMMAFSLMTTAIGNLLVVIISAMSIQNQAYEYLLYAGLMFGDTLLFVYFNRIYRSQKPEKYDAIDDKHEKQEEHVITSF